MSGRFATLAARNVQWGYSSRPVHGAAGSANVPGNRLAIEQPAKYTVFVHPVVRFF